MNLAAALESHAVSSLLCLSHTSSSLIIDTHDVETEQKSNWR
jgi:hypothetical protein